MKTLIAVVTAHPREHWRDAIRETWLPLVPVTQADVRFFMGRGHTNRLYQSDEVVLDCDDSYQGLPEKIREIARWALVNGYDYMLKCDDDVILRPELLLKCGYEKHLYSGKQNRPPTIGQPYSITVGFNYWLSKECMQLISKADLPPELAPDIKDNDDEKWVAYTLFQNGIMLHHDHRYEIYGGETEDKPPTRLYRPLRPPKVNGPNTQDVFSWTIFLEANSGNGIPIETKIAEFRKVFGKVYKKP